MGSVADVTDADFDSQVVGADMPVLIDFWGPNCAPCKAIAPHIETLATEHDGKLKVVKMNIHANMKTAMKYKITGMPTFIVIKRGQEVARQQGTQGGLNGLRKLVDSHI